MDELNKALAREGERLKLCFRFWKQLRNHEIVYWQVGGRGLIYIELRRKRDA